MESVKDAKNLLKSSESQDLQELKIVEGESKEETIAEKIEKKQ